MNTVPRHSRAATFALPILFIAASTCRVVAADDVPTALRCGQIFDVVAGRAIGPATIVVSHGKIESIGVQVPVGAQVVDLGSMICLPGLIDMHTHVVNTPGRSVSNDLDRSSAARALDGLHNAQVMLDTGFTTIRDVGAHDRYYSTVAIRDAIANGQATGPRMFVAPHMIGPTGSHADINNVANDLQIEIPPLATIPFTRLTRTRSCARPSTRRTASAARLQCTQSAAPASRQRSMRASTASNTVC
jgi:imidazolonepropionase-like amidohydrolase